MKKLIALFLALCALASAFFASLSKEYRQQVVDRFLSQES